MNVTKTITAARTGQPVYVEEPPSGGGAGPRKAKRFSRGKVEPIALADDVKPEEPAGDGTVRTPRGTQAPETATGRTGVWAPEWGNLPDREFVAAPETSHRSK